MHRTCEGGQPRSPHHCCAHRCREHPDAPQQEQLKNYKAELSINVDLQNLKSVNSTCFATIELIGNVRIILLDVIYTEETKT